MSRRNLDLVRRALDAYEHDVANWSRLLDPQVEWTPFEEGHTSIGYEQAHRIRREWLNSWESHEIQVEEMIDAGDDVIAVLRLVGIGKASGVPVDVRLHIVFTVRSGRIARILECTSREEALEAVGSQTGGSRQAAADVQRRD